MKAKFVAVLILAALAILPLRALAGNTALLYNGTGSGPKDVVALAEILTAMGISFDKANSEQLNKMSQEVLNSYKLIVWPGGDSIEMGKSLTKETTAKIKTAVSEVGVSYIGFCAGAFMAEQSRLYNVFNLASIWFDFYKPKLKNIVSIGFPDGSRRDLVYIDGPHVQGFGSVLARYPNGLAAIAQGKVGRGFVIVTGVHPEAPADWRRGFASQDHDGTEEDIKYSKTLISAALSRTELPHFAEPPKKN